MKKLILDVEQRRTLHEMGIFHSEARTRQRAQAIVRVSQGVTYKELATEFGVHLSTVNEWISRWESAGVVGLMEGVHSGRPPKLRPEVLDRVRDDVQEHGGTIHQIRERLQAQEVELPVHETTLSRQLKKMGFTWKRTRYSLKKKDEQAFAQAREQLEVLKSQDEAGLISLCYFDESGFSPNPPVQYSWTLRGHTREIALQSHRQRVNVLGCLGRDATLRTTLIDGRVCRNDVIDYLDQLAGTLTRQTVLVLDNAKIHHGEPMEEKRQLWEKKGLRLFYLPPYSPELNLIEIVWKQAKYFWRRCVSVPGNQLHEEVASLMQNYGVKYRINFA